MPMWISGLLRATGGAADFVAPFAAPAALPGAGAGFGAGLRGAFFAAMAILRGGGDIDSRGFQRTPRTARRPVAGWRSGGQRPCRAAGAVHSGRSRRAWYHRAPMKNPAAATIDDHVLSRDRARL